MLCRDTQDRRVMVLTKCGPNNFISFSLPREPHEQYEKAKKNMTLKDTLHRSVGVQYVTEEEWTNSSRKNEEAVSSVQSLSHVQLFATQ